MKVIALVLLFALTACASVTALDRIETVAFCGPSAANGQSAFNDLSKAGFTVLLIGHNEADVGLDMCQKAGIRALLVVNGGCKVPAADFLQIEEDLAKTYRNHPALMGYLTLDEPDNLETILEIGLATARIRAADTKHPIFANLLPGPENWKPYEQNVENYISIVKPDLLSYDRYVLYPDHTEKGTYYLNMEIIRRQAIKHNIPFMNTFLSIPHGPYRDPTEGDLRWQVYTSLAYGAKALCYFTYISFPPGDPSYAGWGTAIVDSNCKPAQKYEIVRRINAEVNKLSPTLIKLKSTAVVHVPAIAGVETDSLVDKPITAISGGEFVIGFLDSPTGENYAMVVNNNLSASAQAMLDFVSGAKVEWCDPNTGKWIKADLQGSTWTVALGAGDARLLRFVE